MSPPNGLTSLYSSSNNLQSNSKQTVLEDSETEGTEEKAPSSSTPSEKNSGLFLEPNSVAKRWDSVSTAESMSAEDGLKDFLTQI